MMIQEGDPVSRFADGSVLPSGGFPGLPKLKEIKARKASDHKTTFPNI